MSLKSNGCIIFIGALTPDRLLITSKHSLGSGGGQGGNISHSSAGERWLRRYLTEKRKTEAEMARVLWNKNWTAIAELCDDSFEEHVLPYPPELTGLHLHGLNESTKQFKTMPSSIVDAFAEEWGFIKTQTVTLNSLAEVRRFRNDIERHKVWNGQAVEGFVVRTHISPPSSDSDPLVEHMPYRSGDDFFFKIKFDEPYMMYRDWREVTKALLSKYDKDPRSMTEAVVPKKKMERPETKVERFQKWLAERQAMSKEMAGGDEAVEASGSKTFGQTVIVPVGVPGSGKTSVAIALKHLFGFAHTQSDDVKSKKQTAETFLRNVLNSLWTHNVVIADKNNHLLQHRNSLRTQLLGFSPPVRFVALDWSHLFNSDEAKARCGEIACERVVARGDNHQTLVVSHKHSSVIRQFIKDTQPLQTGEMDEVIEMQMSGSEDDLEVNVCKTVEELLRILPGLPVPGDEQILEAIEVARAYKVPVVVPVEERQVPMTKKEKKKAAANAPRYYALLPAKMNLQNVINRAFDPASPEASWEHLKSAGRVTLEPHVTIVHSKSLVGTSVDADEESTEAVQALWDRCVSIAPNSSPSFKLKFGHLVWNDRAMALTVDSILPNASSQDNLTEDFVNQLPDPVKRRLHITVGTRTKHILPVEAKGLVERWRKGVDLGGIKSLALEPNVEVEAVLKGLIS
ncbi:RNA ligase-domain-containing protein [Flagelloscypha sp. PMI_526]|nr:RNA ligase-domain-containing protein [Flagelloscypha sp. PMI_526]